jgi:hypothetical protein
MGYFFIGKKQIGYERERISVLLCVLRAGGGMKPGAKRVV